MRKILSLALALVLLLGLVSFAGAEDALPTFDQIKVGEDYLDIKADLRFYSHRTDLANTKFPEYIKAFTAIYPNVTISYETSTDYAQDSIIRLTGGDFGDIMMLPSAIERDEFAKFYVPFGTLETLAPLYNFVDNKEFGGLVYGIPSTGNAQGVVYNKRIFAEAGITELPKTPDEFIAALTAIKEKTGAIPLYTNYAATWPMGSWDAYISGSATGDPAFINQKLLHAKDPFADNGEGYGAYYVYKVLYDAAANGLIEDDYTTTDWESSKGRINNGEIASMVLGSWAYSQMVEAGPQGDDIGYMSFPITVDGKQYASAGADYNYAINVNSPRDSQIAALLYIKWLVHESGFAYSEGGIPIDKNGEYPDLYASFAGIEMVTDLPSLPGEETLLNELNAESTLSINSSGDARVQKIVEHGANGTKSYDAIVAEWNELWSDAQETLGVTVE